VREVAEIIGLTELLERKPKQLSGGQRQRVALGRAIVRKPRVFLFDEPLSNLDAQLRTQMRVEISRLQRLVGSTAVYVTHDQTEAMTMADTIVVMRGGELQHIGTPQEIYAHPANRFVAGFVGSPMMNFFEGGIVNTGNSQARSGAVFQEKNGIALELHHLVPVAFDKALLETITLGIRPENIALEPFTSDSASLSFRATVERIEFLGYERLVYVRTSVDAPLKIVRVNTTNTSIEAGVEYKWFVKPGAYCLFDKTGMRL
jgi:ABC-type sugar transport system ATPase subunit